METAVEMPRRSKLTYNHKCCINVKIRLSLVVPQILITATCFITPQARQPRRPESYVYSSVCDAGYYI